MQQVGEAGLAQRVIVSQQIQDGHTGSGELCTEALQGLGVCGCHDRQGELVALRPQQGLGAHGLDRVGVTGKATQNIGLAQALLDATPHGGGR